MNVHIWIAIFILICILSIFFSIGFVYIVYDYILLKKKEKKENKQKIYSNYNI